MIQLLTGIFLCAAQQAETHLQPPKGNTCLGPHGGARSLAAHHSQSLLPLPAVSGCRDGASRHPGPPPGPCQQQPLAGQQLFRVKCRRLQFGHPQPLPAAHCRVLKGRSALHWGLKGGTAYSGTVMRRSPAIPAGGFGHSGVPASRAPNSASGWAAGPASSAAAAAAAAAGVRPGLDWQRCSLLPP